MSDEIQQMLGDRAKGRKVSDFEFVEEEDGSVSLNVTFDDGGRETFKGVRVSSVADEPDAGVPMILTVKP